MLQVRCLSGAPNFHAPLAQSGMRRLSQKENRVGSNPTGGTTKHSELPEWPIGASWKGDGPARGTRVRISHSLPYMGCDCVNG
jgi:hypothetical protein